MTYSFSSCSRSRARARDTQLPTVPAGTPSISAISGEGVAVDRVQEERRALLPTQAPERLPEHRVVRRLPWLRSRTRPEQRSPSDTTLALPEGEPQADRVQPRAGVPTVELVPVLVGAQIRRLRQVLRLLGVTDDEGEATDQGGVQVPEHLFEVERAGTSGGGGDLHSVGASFTEYKPREGPDPCDRAQMSAG